MKDSNKYGLSVSEDEYEIYKNSGRPVRIYFNQKEALGVIESMSTENINLRPSAINEFFFNGKGERIDNFRIENDLPRKIKKQSVSGIEPLSEGYLEFFVNSVNIKRRKTFPFSKNYDLNRLK